MKNFKSISIFFSIFFSLIANAQSDKGFYASVNTGYNIGTGNVDRYNSMILGIGNSTQIDASTYQIEYLKINFGKGLNAGATLGYMFNKNMGFELGVNYLFGGKNEGHGTELSGDYFNAEASAKMIQIKPTIIVRSGFNKINPYAKVGMVIGSGKITNTHNQKNGADLYNDTSEFYGGMPIGFHANIGTLYKLNEKLSLFGELNLVNLEYAPKKGRLTESFKNGVDQLPSMTVRQKEVEFVTTITESSEPSNPNEPGKSSKIAFTFSSIGLNVGLQYHF